MSIASKLLGIWAVGRTFNTTTRLFIPLLAGMAAVAFCAVVIVTLVIILITGAVWLAYAQLTAYGINGQHSAMILGAVLLALLASIFLVAKHYVRQLRVSSKDLLHLRAPIGGRLSRAFDAFMDGYDKPTRQNNRL